MSHGRAFDRHAEAASLLEGRIPLAVELCGWTPARVAAFRDGMRDAASGRVDQARRNGHWPDDGWVEGGLAPGKVDALGYRDGAEAMANTVAALGDATTWTAADGLAEAERWAGQSTSGAVADGAEWAYKPDADLARLAGGRPASEWRRWFVEEHRTAQGEGRPGYANLLLEEFTDPVVCLVDGDDVEIWDGWHRVAASVVRGSTAIPTLEGLPQVPTLCP